MDFEDHESFETKKIIRSTHHGVDFQVKLYNAQSVTHFGCKNWEALCKMYGFDEGMLDCRIPKIHGDKHTLIKTIHLAKCFPIFATKMGYTLKIVQLYFKIHTMMGP